MNVKHLGTDNNFLTMKNLINAIKESGTELFKFYDCKTVKKDGNSYKVIFTNGEEFSAKNVIIATGRSGANFVNSFCKENSLQRKKSEVQGSWVSCPKSCRN